ncbi:hypothetical protein [Amycolatopsis sp. NPDC049868]|uniref:hypothetical protein n=1 Tax=Amycolatopsis sp. NPDC049868 TaxID=3363934 RepID=UPI00379F7BAA
MTTPRMTVIKVVRAVAFIATLALAAWGVQHLANHGSDAVPTKEAPVTVVTYQRDGAVDAGQALRYERLTGPSRTIVRDSSGAVLMTLTDGTRTVLLTGPRRTFAEPQATDASVVTSAWVRLLSTEWRAGDEQAPWFGPWFAQIRADRSPDVLAATLQYQDGAADERDARGIRFRGDAAFSLTAADFADYLGVPWSFPDGILHKSSVRDYGTIDSSGFIRLVYGYRFGYPLRGGNSVGPGLPRRASAIAELSPGTILIPNARTTATDYAALQPGDLLFFDVEPADPELDHTAIYLGIDTEGHHRFISSRERANGPTLGDIGGASVLDSNGLYAQSWRSARRI